MTVRATGVTAALLCALALVAVGCSDGPGRSAGASGAEAHQGHQRGVPLPPAGAAAPTRHLGPQGGVGQFVIDCGHSHTAPDDPIVHPGAPGMSHDHDFFGNVTVDASSTLDSLLGADSTCRNRLDTAAYWAPVLLDGGEPVTPTLGTAYYRAAPGVEPTDVVAFPPGFMVVAGDHTATEPQPVDLAGWSCGVTTRLAAAPPNCPASAPLRAVITFPDCWDGERLDSPDHRSHTANSSEGSCPESHPVHIPQLTFAITYPVSGTGHDLTLASGSVHGLHSDFVNSWDQDELEAKVRNCLHRDAVCGLASNRAEDPIFSG